MVPHLVRRFEMVHSVVLAIYADNGTRERNPRNAADAFDKFTALLTPFYFDSIINVRMPLTTSCRWTRMYTYIYDADGTWWLLIIGMAVADLH